MPHVRMVEWGVEEREKNNGGEGLLWRTLEVDSLFGRSAKAVHEVRITQTGCIHFLMQACRQIVYYSRN
jgi:hypothetical protein